MTARYYVRATWEPETSVWVSDSDIPGLVIEAGTVAEFEALMNALVPEMLAANTASRGRSVAVDFSLEGRREFKLD